jgi:hypothetical protein
MRPISLLLVLTALTSTALFAQQPIKMPAPASGGPGTATPQPYSPVTPQNLPHRTFDNAPLYKQAPLPESRQPRRDEDVQLLQEQRERNAQPIQKLNE